MRKTHFLTYVISAATFASLSRFAFRQNDIFQLLAAAMLFSSVIAFIASAMCLLNNKSYLKPLYYLPLLSLFVGVYLGPKTGSLLRDRYFLNRMSELNEFVSKLPPTNLQDGVRWKTVRVSSGETKSGNKYVYFWWGGGFPVKHIVIAYHDGDSEQAAKNFQSDWRRAAVLNEHWMVLSD